MIFYVAHKYGGDQEQYDHAKQIVHDLQIKDLQNTYISPLLALSHLGYGELGYREEMELCLDILSVCDALIVCGDESQSKGVQEEVNMARRLHMEVVYL